MQGPIFSLGVTAGMLDRDEKDLVVSDSLLLREVSLGVGVNDMGNLPILIRPYLFFSSCHIEKVLQQ
jgi:hypothetical protein